MSDDARKLLDEIINLDIELLHLQAKLAHGRTEMSDKLERLRMILDEEAKP